MRTNLKNRKEKLIWKIAASFSLLLCVGSVVFSGITSSNLNNQLASIHSEDEMIQKSVKVAEQTLSDIHACKSSLKDVENAYDNYWSAYMGWTDEFDNMMNYGIFAADTVAFIAIPKLATDGDDALSLAKSSSCS